MSYVKAVRGWVKANIEYSLPFVDHFADLFFIRYLGNEAAGFEFFVRCHNCFLLFFNFCRYFPIT